MRQLVCVLIVVLTLAPEARAQTPSGGSVHGVVRDPQGAVVPGVVVTASSPDAPTVHRAVSDRGGAYRLVDLPPGEYTVEAELSGFARVVRPGVIVRAGRALPLDLVMAIGGIGETIEVRQDTPLLETRSGGHAVNVSGELLRAVPLSERREWYGALAVAPGVVTSDFSGSRLIYVRGSEPSATLIQIEGADVTASARAGVSYLQLNTDAVEDVQIQTSGISAATPLGSGGVINIATASGTNRPRGAVSLYAQPRRWNGTNQPGGTSATVDQTQIDASLGGPLVRDHLWGFASYRRTEVNRGISRSSAQLATLGALIDGYTPLHSTNRANFWMGKVTAQAGAGHQIVGFYQQDENPVFDVAATSQHRFGQSTGGMAASARISSVWSDRLTTRLAASYNDKRREGKDHGVAGPVVRVFDNAILSAGRLVGNGSLATLGSPVISRLEQPNEKLTLSFDTTLYLGAGLGTHELQAGAFAQPRVQGNHLVYTNGGFTIEDHVLRQPGVPSSGTRPFHRTIMNGAELTTFEQEARNLAFYVQDAWRPGGRLTFSAGVRVDRVHVEDVVYGITSQRSVDVGPRFGVNYAVTADSRNVVRGFWARVHDQPGLVTTTGTPTIGQQDQYDLDLDGTFETVFVTPPRDGAIANRRLDDDLHQPFVQEWGGGYSRQFGGGTAASIDLVRRRFVDRPTLVEVNGRFEGQVFTGYLDEAFNDIHIATNNRWNTPVYTSLEVSATRRTGRMQAIASYVRQWRHIDGTWQPNDPAAFIQPAAFPNNAGIGSSTGTATATFDSNSLSGFHMTQSVTASAQWQDHVARTALSVDAPWGLLLSTNYTWQSGAWSGPIVTRVPAADPAFGPPTVRLSNGRVVSNPLATLLRFAHPTRGDGQLRTSHLHAWNIRIGRRFSFGRARFDAGLDVFNLTNNGADLGFEFGANQTYNPLYGRTIDRQLPRSAQIALRASF